MGDGGKNSVDGPRMVPLGSAARVPPTDWASGPQKALLAVCRKVLPAQQKAPMPFLRQKNDPLCPKKLPVPLDNRENCGILSEIGN